MIEYAPDIKSARMAIVRDALVGGWVEIFEGKFLLARIPLGAGTVTGPELSFELSEGLATVAGEPDRVRLVDHFSQTIVDELEVGMDVRLDADTLELGQTVRIISAILRHA